MGHLEDPELTNDLTVARDFDLGMTGPPLSISMDFIAGGLVRDGRRPGVGARAVRLRVVGAARARRRRGWRRTGCCARARSGGTATPTRCATRSATPTTPTASPSTRRRPRSCACSGWPAGPSTASSTAARRCTSCSTQATRLRERRCCRACVLVVAANVVVFWSLADGRDRRRLDLGAVVVYAQAAVGTSMIAFGGLNWALDGAAAPVAAVLRLEPAMAPAGALAVGRPSPPTGMPGARDPLPRRHLRLSRRRPHPVLDGFDLTIPAGSSLAIVGQNGAGKTTLAKLLCRLYDPQSRRHRGRRRRPARARPRRRGARGSPPCSRTSSASSCRCATTSRRRARPTTSILAALARRRRRRPGRPRHDPGPGLRGRHRPLRRPVAAGRAGPGAVRGAARRRRGAARRADRAARRAGRGRDLRPHPRRHPRLHDDPHLAPVLDRAPRRPHLRARARPGGRARHPRRADGARRPLPHDVRAAGAARSAPPRKARRRWCFDVLS